MRLAFLFFTLFFVSVLRAQSDVWTLQRSVHYAIEHNISLQQNVLNQRLAALQLQQSKWSQLPNLNAGVSVGRSYGRSVDPTTNQFVHGSYDFVGMTGSADVLLFGWFQRRNTIQANKYNLEAAKANLDQLQNDISLNVATGYLRALLAQEQVRVSAKQVDLSAAQLEQTRKFVDAGRLPELNAAQLEAQLANDSANLISNISAYTSSILDIKALLNLDFQTPFEIQAPEVNVGEQLSVYAMTPESIFQQASQRFGSIKASEWNLLAAQKRLRSAQAARYPQLGLNAQFGTNYATTFSEITGGSLGQGTPSELYYVQVDTLQVPVYQRTFNYTTRRIPFGSQLDNNFRQTVTATLNFPLFNAWQAQYNVRQAKINLSSNELNKYQAELKLRQDVYRAYNDALNAIQKFKATERAVDAARRAYNFAQKRYVLGLTNTVEYLTSQNAQFVAEINRLSAKYDLIFKLKVIDYYLNKELTL
ncbi:MAG: TolC family protein [Bacteroidetes bacterium]|nr:TolC family protein [Bacteroidota bacterium]MBS1738914.1 TolC family protein [Bacteroidota bacterium]